MTTLTDQYLSFFIKIVPLLLTLLLLSSPLRLLSISFQNCLPALLLNSSKKPHVLLLYHPSSVIPSAVLFLFHSLPCYFLALVAQQHQVVFGGTEKIEEKKQHIHCEGSFVILQTWWV